MRKPKYLSPTSMQKWREDPSKYYLRYLSDTPPPKEPQTLAMAIGSAFDAFVKSFLHEALFGKGDAQFELRTLFEAQVEPQNRDKTWVIGDELLGAYRRLGALDGLMLMLGKSVGKPRFEMDVRGDVSAGHVGEIKGVPFRVKPDLFFVSELGAHVIFDWKVNGYVSASGASPKKGYVKLREDGKRPSSYGDAHKDYLGITTNAGRLIEMVDQEWAAQLSVGSWMCGEEVGAKFVAIVHQLVCRPGSVRVAEHCSLVTKEWQEQLHSKAVEMWRDVNSDWVFRSVGLSQPESVELCKLLDQRRDFDMSTQGTFSPLTDGVSLDGTAVQASPGTPAGDGWIVPPLD